jgi:hypothetical protein
VEGTGTRPDRALRAVAALVSVGIACAAWGAATAGADATIAGPGPALAGAAPTAVADVARLSEGAPAQVIDVLHNDLVTDPGMMALASITQPENGTVAVNVERTRLTYRPDPGYCNSGGPPDTFTYSLIGGSTATVAITVECSYRPPLKLSISHRRVRLVDGRVELHVLCTGPLGSRCTGTLALTPAARLTRQAAAVPYGRARFDMPVAHAATLRIEAPARLRALLVRRHTAVAIATARLAGVSANGFARRLTIRG